MGVRRGGRNARGGQRVHAVTERWSAHSAPGVGLLVAAATAPGTFSSSLSARSALDQGIVTGLATGLHHLLSVSTQDVLEAVASALVGDTGDGVAGSAARRRMAQLAVDGAVVPVGLVVARCLPARTGETPVRGATRQLAWRFTATGLAGVVLHGTDAAVRRLDDRLGAGGRLTALPLAVPVGLGLSFL